MEGTSSAISPVGTLEQNHGANVRTSGDTQAGILFQRRWANIDFDILPAIANLTLQYCEAPCLTKSV